MTIFLEMLIIAAPVVVKQKYHPNTEQEAEARTAHKVAKKRRRSRIRAKRRMVRPYKGKLNITAWCGYR